MGVRGAISQKGLVNFFWYAYQIEAFFISVYPKEKFWMVEFLHSVSHCARSTQPKFLTCWTKLYMQDPYYLFPPFRWWSCCCAASRSSSPCWRWSGGRPCTPPASTATQTPSDSSYDSPSPRSTERRRQTARVSLKHVLYYSAVQLHWAEVAWTETILTQSLTPEYLLC